MANGYNSGGAYVGKRWVPMWDEYLWYKIFMACNLTKDIAKMKLDKRASNAQIEAQRQMHPMDIMESTTWERKEEILKEYSEIGEDGIRRLKNHERYHAYEQEYWGKWLEELEQAEIRQRGEVQNFPEHLTRNPYLEDGLRRMKEERMKTEEEIREFQKKLRE